MDAFHSCRAEHALELKLGTRERLCPNVKHGEFSMSSSDTTFLKSFVWISLEQEISRNIWRSWRHQITDLWDCYRHSSSGLLWPEQSPKKVCGDMCPHWGVAHSSSQGVTAPSFTAPFPLERPLTPWGFPSHRAVEGKVCAAAARLWAGLWFLCIWLCRGDTAAPALRLSLFCLPHPPLGKCRVCTLISDDAWGRQEIKQHSN